MDMKDRFNTGLDTITAAVATLIATRVARLLDAGVTAELAFDSILGEGAYDYLIAKIRDQTISEAD